MSGTLFGNSLLLAGAATFLALGCGWVAALCGLGLGRAGRVTLVGAAIAVLALPPFLGVNAWVSLFGIGGPLSGWLPVPLFSLPVAITILGLMFWPVPFLLVLGGWQRLRPELLESEPALRGRALVRWLLLPSSLGYTAVGGAIAFVLALNQFAVPALLQVKVYPAEVWLRFNAGLDALGALALSWPMILAPALLLLLAWRRGVPWPRFTGTLDPGLIRERLGRWPTVALRGIVLGLTGLSLVLPLALLGISPNTWIELGPALRASAPALLQSGWSAAVTATVVVALALGLARWRWPAAGWLFFLMPGVVLGVGLIVALNRPPFLAFYQSVAVVVLAWTLRTLGPGWAVVRHALQSVDPRLRDVARLEGAGPWATFRLVIWPEAGQTLSAAWYIVFLLCLWDSETLVLIMPPGGETVALRIFNFLHYGHHAQVNALCLLLLALALVPLLLGLTFQLLARWRRSAQVRWGALGLACGLSLTGCGPADSSQAGVSSRIFASAQAFGSRGSGPGQFQKPRSVAVDAQDNFYVVDMTSRVQSFTPAGEYVGSWQLPVTDLGKPKGMCRDAQGRIVVLEPHYARVNHFAPNGTLEELWGEQGINPGQLDFPRDVAVAPDGRLYVSEYLRSERVQVFSPDRQLQQVIGAAGRGPGQFNRAEGIALDAHGRLYVADSCNHRVQIFDADGSFLLTHGRPGSGPGEMSYPYDIAVDVEGRHYVCEFGNSRIQVFDQDGRWLETIGGPGAAPGRFSNPWSIALDSRGNLYVADSMNHRVQKLLRR